MQDVLSLTASGNVDIPVGSLVIGHTSGLQTQLNAKASTSALNAAADSIALEIDELDAGVGALGDTLSAVGAAVATKASQTSLDATNAEVATKARQTSLDVTNASVTIAYSNIMRLGHS